MAATRPRPDEPSSALTWVAIVITLGITLALVAIFGGPKDVRLKADMGTCWLMNCEPNEGKTFPAASRWLNPPVEPTRFRASAGTRLELAALCPATFRAGARSPRSTCPTRALRSSPIAATG